MLDSYWTKISRRQMNRRTALLASGAAGLGAALFAACGGGSDNGPKTGDKSGLLSQPEDTSKRAVRAGVWQSYRTDDPTTLDPISNISSLSWNDMLYVYSHLTKAGIRSDKPDAFEGDAAGQPHHAGLRSVVVRVPRVTHEPVGRSHVQDDAGALGREFLRDGPSDGCLAGHPEDESRLPL